METGKCWMEWKVGNGRSSPQNSQSKHWYSELTALHPIPEMRTAEQPTTSVDPPVPSTPKPLFYWASNCANPLADSSHQGCCWCRIITQHYDFLILQMCGHSTQMPTSHCPVILPPVPVPHCSEKLLPIFITVSKPQSHHLFFPVEGRFVYLARKAEAIIRYLL